MTSRLEIRHRYSATPDQLRQVMTDPEYLRAKLSAVGGPGAELVSRKQNGQDVVVVLRQGVPADALPSFVRSFLPGDLTIERTETWTDSGGSVYAEVDGAPGTINGQMRLTPDGGGSVLSLRLEAQVPLPLVGGKVEKVITDSVGKLMETEYGFTERWLRDSQPE
jgi:hypothetical protein